MAIGDVDRICLLFLVAYLRCSCHFVMVKTTPKYFCHSHVNWEMAVGNVTAPSRLQKRLAGSGLLAPGKVPVKHPATHACSYIL